MTVQPPIEPFSPAAPLTGAPNFRDLGGLTGAQGRRVRAGRLFRSDHMGSIEPADHALLAGLGVRRIMDFRSPIERDAFPCAVSGPLKISIPIQSETSMRLEELIAERGRISGEEARGIMREVYRNYLRSYGPVFRSFFAELLADDGPHVFHCTAGKDRTGIASAMLLTALGVSHADIVRDYLLTNERWAMASHMGAQFPADVRDAIARADPSYLEAAFRTLADEFGGFHRYAREQLALDATQIGQLQAFYLEP